MNKPNKLIIMSLDALNFKDFDIIKDLPIFKEFMTQGAYVKKVQSVYPTLTYTCHTSLSSGHYPKDHGVYNNEFAQPTKSLNQDWRWFEWDIKSPTFFDYAKLQNLTTASILWPVMAGADLTYNVPEIWSPDGSVSRFKLLWDYGTKNMLWPVFKFKKLLQGTSQPYLDDFTEAVSLYTLRKHQPDVMAIHFTELDTFRHLYGLEGRETVTRLESLNQRVTNLLNLTKELGLYDQTNFVLLGDHGTHTFDHIIYMNTFFKEKGYLTCDQENTILTWDVYACTCGGSCHIHVRPNLSLAQLSRLKLDLYNLVGLPDSPIKHIFTKEEILDLQQLSGDFTYVLEAKDGYVFRNGVTDTLVEDAKNVKGAYKGDHGYLPTQQDMYTTLLMMGPDIKKGAYLETCDLIDEGPTFVKLLGTEMEKVDGKILSALLN